MALTVTNNLYSLNAQNNLNSSQTGLQKSLERLSSGYRINKAADDAAGLAISEKMRANVRALSQASRNASDGVALIQTAEGALDEVGNMLVRMKELAEQAATETVGSTERGYLQSEFDALKTEINRISDNAKYNETELLDGTLSVNIQIGTSNGSGDKIAITVADTDTTALSLSSTIDTATNAAAMLSTVNSAISTVASRRSGLGALQNRLESVISNLDTMVENLTGAESRIRDVDVAAETANMTKYNIMVQAGVSVLAQANQVPSIALSLLG